MSDACGSCGAPVLWKVNPKGKRVPIDPEPVLGGNVQLDGDHEIVYLTRLQRVTAMESGDLMYQTHFVSCPDAVQWRK